MAKQQTAAPAAAAVATSATATDSTFESLLDKEIGSTQHERSIRDTAAQFLGIPPQKACQLLRNVWKVSKGEPELTDAEMFIGMSMIARFGLDPIAREVYVTRDGKGRMMTVVGIDGWVKILNRTEDYDGFEQELHADESGAIDWVETRIYSKARRHPSVYRAFAKEYAKLGGFMAEKIPSHMLRLFSLRHAARLFTPIGGSVVTEEEARWMQAYEQAEDKRPVKRRQVSELPALTAAEAAASDIATDLTANPVTAAADPLCVFRADVSHTNVADNLARKLAAFVTANPELREQAEQIAMAREVELGTGK